MRDKLVDALKGYACLLVVFGHVIMGIRKSGVSIPYGAQNIEEFIWTFHVALFMFLSGYVYQVTGEWKSKGNRFSFIKHKFINLAIPYFIFSIAYICINMVLGGSSVNSEMNLNNIFLLWKKPIAQYWFLYDLFFIFFAFTILSKWMKNWQITFLLVGTQVITSLLKISVPMPFAAMIRMVLPFGIGASIKKIEYLKNSNVKKISFLVIHLILTELVLCYSLDELILIDMLISVLGCFSSIFFIGYLVKINQFNNFLLFICKYSFPIYLLHTIFTAGIRIVMLKCGIDNYFLHVIIGCLGGLLCPFVIAKVCDEIDIFNFFFYPGKVIKKYQKKRK